MVAHTFREITDAAAVGSIDVPRRIMFPTIPSSGSTWIRTLVDMSRGIASEAVYGTNEGGMWHPETMSYGHACGRTEGHKLHSELCTRIRGAVAPEAVLIKTHWPFANFIASADERFARPSTVGGVIKTVRDPRTTYSDCVRKQYAAVHLNKTFDWFLLQHQRHHAYWDAMAARNVRVVNIPFEKLQSIENVTDVLVRLGKIFFPEITHRRARLAVSLYPPRGPRMRDQNVAT